MHEIFTIYTLKAPNQPCKTNKASYLCRGCKENSAKIDSRGDQRYARSNQLLQRLYPSPPFHPCIFPLYMTRLMDERFLPASFDPELVACRFLFYRYIEATGPMILFMCKEASKSVTSTSRNANTLTGYRVCVLLVRFLFL